MSALAISQLPTADNGLHRSAALMRALGARASSVWATLSPEDAQRLTTAMDAMPENSATEHAAARAYVEEMTSPRATAPAAQTNLWQTLSSRDGAANASLIQNESPQVIAVILSRLSPNSAATTVRALPQALATEALHRLLHLGDVRPAALKAIETTLLGSISTAHASISNSGHERIARIFDSLDSRAEQSLLASLDDAEPGIRDRIRALMFTFDDLATLGPASIQTILSATDRAVLIVALKGAKDETAKAVFSNMTSRAADLLRSEIEATGPIRRSEIEAARAELITSARTLVKRGDILSGEPDEDDELIE